MDSANIDMIHVHFNRLQAAKNYIDNEYHLAIQVKDLAAIACMSEFHFYRLFKKYFHLTPYQYCLQKRLETAVTYLVTTSDTINTIADKTGFKDIHSFSRTFKTVYHISPSEFRRKMILNEIQQ